MRKREERFRWLEMTAAEQLHVIKLCQQRYRRKMAAGKPGAQNNDQPDSPQQELF